MARGTGLALVVCLLLTGCSDSQLPAGTDESQTSPDDRACFPVDGLSCMQPSPKEAPGPSGAPSMPFQVPEDGGRLRFAVPWNQGMHSVRFDTAVELELRGWQPYDPPDGTQGASTIGLGFVLVALDAPPCEPRGYTYVIGEHGFEQGWFALGRLPAGAYQLHLWRDASYEGRPVSIRGPMGINLGSNGTEVQLAVQQGPLGPPKRTDASAPAGAPLTMEPAALTFVKPYVQSDFLFIGNWTLRASLEADESCIVDDQAGRAEGILRPWPRPTQLAGIQDMQRYSLDFDAQSDLDAYPGDVRHGWQALQFQMAEP